VEVQPLQAVTNALWRRSWTWIAAAVIAIAAVAGKIAIKGGAVAAGYVAGLLRSDDADTRALGRGLRDGGIDPDSLVRADPDITEAEWRRLAAAGRVMLDPNQQDEVMVFQSRLADRLPIPLCASAFWRGIATPSKGEVEGVTSADAWQRISYLTGLGTGRLLRAGGQPPAQTVTDERWGDILTRHASPAVIELIVAAGEIDTGSLSDDQACAAARAMYRTIREIPAGTPERADAVRFVLGLGTATP